MSDIYDAIERYTAAEERQLRPIIQPLCERHGYGRMMQLISQWWREKDPLGAISLGPCYGTLEAAAKAARKPRKATRAKRGGR